ncbi:tetrahydrofolate synthase [Treponema sp. OttesenSCG-928-L16]|nr:tetrahydrofolate synthase [Treponema sp. OttesenSCG-928-L16]
MDKAPVFTASSDVFDWLSRFINLERGQSSKSFRLDRMQILSGLAGHPESCAPVIHVAGSKGKGSVTAMAASILTGGGLKTARYTSPHLLDYRERVCLGNGSFFDEYIYLQAGDELYGIVSELRKKTEAGSGLFDPGGVMGEEPTFFELLTLYFFLCARLARCEAMVVETGMGGRLDATNIVCPEVSVITSIELEHTEYLGNTLTAIASEKGGIVKAGTPLVLTEQKKEVCDYFRNLTEEKASPLIYVPERSRISGAVLSGSGKAYANSFTLDIEDGGGADRIFDITLPVPGEIQARNAAAAVLAVLRAFPGISGDAIRSGLAQVRLPARFDLVCEEPLLIADGAHTPNSLELSSKTFCELYGAGGILLFGCAAGKDAAGMAGILVSRFSRIIITTPGSFKKSMPEEVYRIFSETAGAAACRIDLIPDTPLAMETAIKAGTDSALPILCAGSFYLAAELYHYLKKASSSKDGIE